MTKIKYCDYNHAEIMDDDECKKCWSLTYAKHNMSTTWQECQTVWVREVKKDEEKQK